MAELRIHDNEKHFYKSIKTVADDKHVVVNLPEESGKLGTHKDLENGSIRPPTELITFLIKKPDITKNPYIQSDFDVNRAVTLDTYTTSEVFLGQHTKTILQIAIDDKFKLIVSRLELEPTKTTVKLPSIPGYKGNIWVRYRFLSSDVTSEWSDAYKLSYNRKTVVTPKTTIVEKATELEVTAISFSCVGDGADPTHEYTDWELVAVSPSGESSIWESKNDRLNKTSISIPKNNIKAGEEYILKTTYFTNVEGGESATYHNRFIADEISLPAPTLTKTSDAVNATPFVAPSSDYTHKKTIWIMKNRNNTLKLTTEGNDKTRMPLTTINGNKIKCYFLIEYNSREYFTPDSNELEVVGTGGVRSNVDSILQGWANGLSNIDGTVQDTNNKWLQLEMPTSFQEGEDDNYVYIQDAAIDQMRLRIKESNLSSNFVNLIQNIESARVTMYFRRDNKLVPIGNSVVKEFAKEQTEHVFELKEIITDATVGKRLADYLVDKSDSNIDVLYDTNEVDGKIIRSFVLPITFKIFMSVMGKFLELELNHNLVYKLGTRSYQKETLPDTNVANYYTTAGRFTTLPNWIFNLLKNNKTKYTDGVLINIYTVPDSGIEDKRFKELITKEINSLVRESTSVDGISLFKIDGLLNGIKKGEYRDIVLNMNFYNTRVAYRRDYLLYDPQMTIVMDNSLYTLEGDVFKKVAGRGTQNFLNIETGHNPKILPGKIKVINPINTYTKDINTFKITFTGVDNHTVSKTLTNVKTELADTELKTQLGIEFNTLGLREQQYAYKIEFTINTGLKKEVTGNLRYIASATLPPDVKPLPPVNKEETLILKRDGTIQGNWDMKPEIIFLNNPSFTDRIDKGNTWIENWNESLEDGSDRAIGVELKENDTLNILIVSRVPIENYPTADAWKAAYPLYLEDIIAEYKRENKLNLLDSYKNGDKEINLKLMTLRDGEQLETLDILTTKFLYAGYYKKDNATYKYMIFNIQNLNDLKVGNTNKKTKLFQNKEVFWLKLTIPSLNGNDKVLDIIDYAYKTYYSTAFWSSINILEDKAPNYKGSKELVESKILTEANIQDLIHKDIQLTFPPTTDPVELRRRKESWSGVQRGLYLTDPVSKTTIHVAANPEYPYAGESRNSLQGLLSKTSFTKVVLEGKSYKTILTDKAHNGVFSVDVDEIDMDPNENEINAVPVSVRELLLQAGLPIRKEPITGSVATNCDVPTVVTTYGVNPKRVFKLSKVDENETMVDYITVTPPLINISIQDLLIATYDILTTGSENLVFTSLGKNNMLGLHIPELKLLKEIISSPLSPYWFKAVIFRQDITYNQLVFKAYFAGKIVNIPITNTGYTTPTDIGLNTQYPNIDKIEIVALLKITDTRRTAMEYFAEAFKETDLKATQTGSTVFYEGPGRESLIPTGVYKERFKGYYDPVRNTCYLGAYPIGKIGDLNYKMLFDRMGLSKIKELTVPYEYRSQTLHWHTYWKNGKIFCFPVMPIIVVDYKELISTGIVWDRSIPSWYKKRNDIVMGNNKYRVKCFDTENTPFALEDFVIKDWNNHSLYSDTVLASLSKVKPEDPDVNAIGKITSPGGLIKPPLISDNSRYNLQEHMIEPYRIKMNKILFKDANMSTTGIELANNADYKTPGNKFHMASQGLMANNEYVPQRFNTLTSELLERYKRQEVIFWPVLEIIPGAYYELMDDSAVVRSDLEYYIVIRARKTRNSYNEFDCVASIFLRFPTIAIRFKMPDAIKINEDTLGGDSDPYPTADRTIMDPKQTKTKEAILAKLETQSEFFPYGKQGKKGYALSNLTTRYDNAYFYNYLVTYNKSIEDISESTLSRENFKKLISSRSESYPSRHTTLRLKFPHYYKSTPGDATFALANVKDEYIVETSDYFIYKAKYKGNFSIASMDTSSTYRINLTAE